MMTPPSAGFIVCGVDRHRKARSMIPSPECSPVQHATQAPRTGYTPVHAPPWQALTRCHSQATEAPRDRLQPVNLTPSQGSRCAPRRSPQGQGDASAWAKCQGSRYGPSVRSGYVLATGTMLPMAGIWFAAPPWHGPGRSRYADSGRDTRREGYSLRVGAPWQGQV